jgi:two-component system, OmpR family, clock-associated histidine kinase SasA
MEAQPLQTNPDAPLQLVLFVDKRPNSTERIRQIRACLKRLSVKYDYELQVVDVSEQPHLAEHFKLVATPCLIRIYPEPRQTLAGNDLVGQIEQWWTRWERAIEDCLAETAADPSVAIKPRAQIRSVSYSAEVIKLSDEIFQLQREKEDLLAQLQFKDHLISMLAHDLRNPLTAVSIALETLEMGTKEATEKRLTPKLLSQLVRHARNQTKAINHMITDILHTAKEKSAEFRIQPREMDLSILCQEVLEGLRNQFDIKGQTVKTDLPSDLPKVYADADRIRQVMMNLLDNAIKYTPEQGKIQVSILHRTTQKVQVSICDDGPGIPEENQRLIFEDRFRLQRDEATDGYGIGLALCKRIVQAHYGQIWVDSVPQHGSCFHFTLPVYRRIGSPIEEA